MTCSSALVAARRAVRIAVGLTVLAIAPTALAVTFSAIPALSSTGETITVRATGLPPGGSYTLEYFSGGTITIASAVGTAQGVLQMTPTLPTLPSGNGRLRLRSSTGLVGDIAFTALAGMTFTPLTANPHAGQWMRFRVTNLAAGTLTLMYEDEAVFGPVPVGDGTYEGRFVLPSDRPATLPGTAGIDVLNKVGTVVVNRLARNVTVQPRYASPFTMTTTQPPPSNTRPGQVVQVRGNGTIGANEQAPEMVSLWHFGSNGEVIPLASAYPTVTGNQYTYTMPGQIAGGLSMSAGENSSGNLRVFGPGTGSLGMGLSVIDPGSVFANPLPPDRWQVSVRLLKPGGAPIPGATVQFDGVPAQALSVGGPADPEDDDGIDFSGYSALDYIVSADLPTQYGTIAGTDDRGCPLTFARKLTNNNGIAEFEFLDSDLSFAQIPFFYAEAGGTIEVIGHNSVMLGIDASAAGYGFQWQSGPDAGDFLPHIYEAAFGGAGNGDPQDDSLNLIDFYQDVSTYYRDGRIHTYTLGLPQIQPMVGLYDTTILPWTARKGPVIFDTQNGESFGYYKMLFGPIYSKRGINSSWIVDRPGEGYPTTFAVRTDPAVSGVVTSAKLYLSTDADAAMEYVVDFVGNASAVDCSIMGLDSSMTWRAPMPPGLSQWAAGTYEGYVEFIGSPAAGRAKRKFSIQLRETNLSWLSDSRFSNRTVEFSSGGQRIGILAEENVRDAVAELPSDPGYDIGRLRNSTQNTRLIEAYYNHDGTSYVSAPVDGAHREAGQLGDPTSIDIAPGEIYDPAPITLFDQSFPLFYYVWGVPVLAGIEVGADFSLLAEIDMYSKVELGSNKQPQLTLRTTPSIDLGLNFYIDIDVLFDLVDGGVDLDAVFALDMPISVTPQNPTPSIDECFTALLTFSWHFEVWCPPFDPICDAFNDIEGSEELLREQTGSGCNVANALLAGGGPRDSAQVTPSNGVAAYSPSGDGFMAFTRQGPTTASLVVRPVGGGNFVNSTDDQVLSTAPGIRSVAIAWLNDERAVIVWAENTLSAAVLRNTPALERIARQRLMYATWNGETWSAKTVLTPASGGEGGVELAACVRAYSAACPSGGEVLATWTRDMAGNMAQHRTRVYFSRYTVSGGWTAPAPVDASAILDSSPSAAWVDGEPVVAFVRSTNGVFGDTEMRRIAYRFVGAGNRPVQVPAGVPGGVAWPSIVSLDDGEFVIAHTHASDPRAFVGNTQRVALVNATACASGICTATAQALSDTYGRPIFGERPTAVVDDAGHVTVVLRGMGFGDDAQGDNSRPEDPIGMALHTGELMSLAITRNAGTVSPVPLSDDGAGYFAPRATYDRGLGRVVALGTRGAVLPEAVRSKYLASGAKPSRARAKGVEPEDGLLVYAAEEGMDLAVERITLNNSQLVGGSSVQITTRIRNRGTDYLAGLPPWTLRLSWDAPYDAGGTSAGTRPISSLDAGEFRDIALTVTVPAGFSPDQQHRLYATLYRNGSSREDVEGDNNQLFQSLGGVPAPEHVNASHIKGTTMVQLVWTAPADPGDVVAGYRVWCHDGDGRWRHLGSSFENGFLDLAAPLNVERHYRVTAYSRNAIESPPADEVSATATKSDVMFRNGFE